MTRPEQPVADLVGDDAAERASHDVLLNRWHQRADPLAEVLARHRHAHHRRERDFDHPGRSLRGVDANPPERRRAMRLRWGVLRRWPDHHRHQKTIRSRRGCPGHLPLEANSAGGPDAGDFAARLIEHGCRRPGRVHDGDVEAEIPPFAAGSRFRGVLGTGLSSRRPGGDPLTDRPCELPPPRHRGIRVLVQGRPKPFAVETGHLLDRGHQPGRVHPELMENDDADRVAEELELLAARVIARFRRPVELRPHVLVPDFVSGQRRQLCRIEQVERRFRDE